MATRKKFNDPIVEEMKKRFELSADATKEQRQRSLEDLKFCDPENQWDTNVKNLRSAEGRPSLSFDRLGQMVAQIVNAERENKPSVLVKPVNGGADVETAEIYQGLIRHIDVSSASDQAIDVAFESAVRMGFGFYRILTRYEDTKSFNLEPFIKSIINPFSVYWDPTTKEPDGSDMDWCIITEDLTDEEYKRQFPTSQLADYNEKAWLTLGDEEPKWFTSKGENKGCRICEYWRKERTTKKIYRVGKKVYFEDELPKNKRKEDFASDDIRETDIEIVKCYKCNGVEILKEDEWAGKYIPIIPVWGSALHLGGETIYSGMVRNLKSEQVHLNLSKNNLIETAGMVPKAPWVGPIGFTAGGENKQVWQNSNRVNYSYLEYAVEDDQGRELPPPTRNFQEPAVQALIEIANMAENDLKATSGLYDPALGNKMSLNQSGVAIKSLQTQGAIGNFHYSDNLNRSLRLEGLILLDLIPKIYDTERVVRIIGMDNEHKQVRINGTPDVDEDTGNIDKDGVLRIFKLNDEDAKYDVVISSGPSFQTRREEDRNMLFDLFQRDPSLFQNYSDVIFGTLDSPAAVQLTERAKALLPTNLQNLDGKKKMTAQQLTLQLQDAQQTIQQLTEHLQQETKLADHEESLLRSKLQIAQLEQQTQLMKERMAIEGNLNVAALQAEIKANSLALDHQRELITNLQQHLLDKDMAAQQAALDQQTQAAQAQQQNQQDTPQNNSQTEQ